MKLLIKLQNKIFFNISFLSLIIFKTDIENLKFKDEIYLKEIYFFYKSSLITSTVFYNLFLHENISNFHFILQIFLIYLIDNYYTNYTYLLIHII